MPTRTFVPRHLELEFGIDTLRVLGWNEVVPTTMVAKPVGLPPYRTKSLGVLIVRPHSDQRPDVDFCFSL